MQAYFPGNEAFSYVGWQAVAEAGSRIQLSSRLRSENTGGQNLTVILAFFVSCLNSFRGNSECCFKYLAIATT